MTQIDAVRRKLVASLHATAIDHAVKSYGLNRVQIEEALVLCGGDADLMRSHWNRFSKTPAARRHEHEFDLQDFLEFLREQQPKSDTPVPGALPARRRRRGKRRR